MPHIRRRSQRRASKQTLRTQNWSSCTGECVPTAAANGPMSGKKTRIHWRSFDTGMSLCVKSIFTKSSLDESFLFLLLIQAFHKFLNIFVRSVLWGFARRCGNSINVNKSPVASNPAGFAWCVNPLSFVCSSTVSSRPPRNGLKVPIRLVRGNTIIEAPVILGAEEFRRYQFDSLSPASRTQE